MPGMKKKLASALEFAYALDWLLQPIIELNLHQAKVSANQRRVFR